MKFILLITLLWSASALASRQCGDYEFQGTLRITETGFVIGVNENTLSEIKIRVPKTEELKLVPFHNKLVSGKVLMRKENAFSNLEFAVPDGKQFLKLKKWEKCP